jgi:aminoglycoside 3-N-acetyltransferase
MSQPDAVERSRVGPIARARQSGRLRVPWAVAGVITADDMTRALADLGLRPDDTVMVHSGMRDLLRVQGRGRDEKLATVVDALRAAVPGGRLVMPSFSYSFTRGEDYDLQRSPGIGLGVLPEYFRGLPGVRRTTDPLFSAAILGPVPAEWEEPLFGVHDVDCFGAGSVFDFLYRQDARLLFLGVPATANTYAHYVEQMLEVPYRYFKDFRGRVVRDGDATEVTARFYVRELESDVEVFLAPLADDLLRAGEAVATAMDRGPSLFLTGARAIARQAELGVAANPDYLLRRGHPEADHLYPLLAP